MTVGRGQKSEVLAYHPRTKGAFKVFPLWTIETEPDILECMKTTQSSGLYPSNFTAVELCPSFTGLMQILDTPVATKYDYGLQGLQYYLLVLENI